MNNWSNNTIGMKMEHTPGPWTADGTIIKSYRDNGYTKIAKIGDFMPARTDEANACLIAAAPDGLSANIKALEALLWAEAAGLPVGEHIEQVRAAITKATNSRG